MILLLSPQHDARELQRVMQRNGFTHFEELDSRAGFRRFRLY